MSLSANYSFVGRGNWSLDSTSGSATGGGAIDVVVPEGSRIEAAFLYGSTYFNSSATDVPVTLSAGATSVNVSGFTPLGFANSFLQAFRADVTGFVSSVVGNGDPSTFTFNVSDLLNGGVDGYALAVVYSNPNEALRTIAFLDGASATSGDSFNVTFADPVDTTVPGFEALLSLGIGFGFQGSGQFSNVSVNGRPLTSSAGGQDDGSGTNGALITIGGIGDSKGNPGDPTAGPSGDPRIDDELYNLAEGNSSNSAPFINNGDTTLIIDTLNPSNDDNIFFAGINLTTAASIDTGENDAPVAVSDGGEGFTTDEDTVLVTGDVLGNDFDPDGDAFTFVSFDDTGTNGIVTDNTDGTFTYDPNGAYDYLKAGETATDFFTYKIFDGSKQGSGTVSVTINGVNDKPDARNDSGFNAQYQTAVTILAAALLANDVDAEGDPLAISSVQNAVNGTVSLDSFGNPVFTPNSSYSGPASFTYTISDGQGGTDTATVNLTVAGPTAGGGTLFGGPGNDVLNGTVGVDTIYGQGGDDRINAGNGNDFVYGGNGNDTIFGGNGDDRLYGEGGNDTIYGGAGSDFLNGGDGNDSLYGEADNDVLFGGAGDDLLNGGDGNDQLFGEAGIDRLFGGNGVDILSGGDGNDQLFGDAGNDRLVGGAGNDLLNGGAGQDRLEGGLGRDILAGGADNDVFIFSSVAEIGLGVNSDRIIDFATGDKIDFSNIDANSSSAFNDAFSFIGNVAFSGVSGELRFTQNAADTLIQGDVDGDGIADFELQIAGLISPVNSDFLV
jgi:VCBS repeat-containing protein